MADGSNGNRGLILPLWRCKYCSMIVPGFHPDSFEFCPKCGKEQKQEPLIPEIVCINPECKATLFSAKSEMCHKCKKPQQQKPVSTRSDSSKHEEHKLNIAQAVQAKKQQSQEPETTTEMAASHGAGGLVAAGNQSAAEPQKGGAQTPPDAPTLKQGETSENPIVIDSTNVTVPDKGMSTEAAETAKGVNKSATEGTTKDEGNRFQESISANVNVDGQKTNKTPKGTSPATSDVGDPSPAKEKGTQDQPPGSGVPSPDSNKLVPDSKSTGPGVPDTALARMSIEDVRMPNRKRSHEGDGDHPPKDTSGSSTPSTYAAAAKTPATATQPSQTQPSVPPVKKQRNNITNDPEPHGSSVDAENYKTTHLPSSSNQSGDPQVYVWILVIFMCSALI